MDAISAIEVFRDAANGRDPASWPNDKQNDSIAFITSS
jgi:hypothetical protein